MKLICQKCGCDLEIEDVDLASDKAVCPACGSTWDCRTWADAEFRDEKKLAKPPPGVVYNKTPNGFEITITTRSYEWLFLLPFTAFASVIFGIFAWGFLFTKPHDRDPSDAAARHFAILFLTPFWCGTIWFWWLTLMAMVGKFHFTLDGDTATYFQGLGQIGRRRRLSWPSLRNIRLESRRVRGGFDELLVLEGDRVVECARKLRHDLLVFLLTALRTHQVRRS